MGKPNLGEHSRLEVIIQEACDFKVPDRTHYSILKVNQQAFHSQRGFWVTNSMVPSCASDSQWSARPGTVTTSMRCVVGIIFLTKPP